MSEITERLQGPHEWGYRDPVEGGFVADATPFAAAETITALRTQAAADKATIERLTRERDEALAALAEVAPTAINAARAALSAESGAEPQEPCRTCGDEKKP